MPRAEAAKIIPRTRTIPQMGDPQPVLVAATVSRPVMKPPPAHDPFEPILSPRIEKLRPPTYDSTVPRTVVEADLEDLFEWGVPRFQRRYPRATEQTLRPYFTRAISDPRHRFLRTTLAFGLFVAGRTPWEPELMVSDIFVVGRAPIATLNGEGPDKALHKVGFEALNIYKAGKAWAESIGAWTFNFGQSTGIDLEPIAKRLGCDFRQSSFCVTLRAE